MRITVIGRGNVGATLGRRLAEAGHRVRYGVRSPGADDEAPVADAVADAEAVLLAVPWTAVPDVLRTAGDLDGRIVLDCTNPLRRTETGLALVEGASGAERTQALVPGAVVFKAFNTTGFEIMADPSVDGHRAMMPFCGDDVSRREDVRSLVQDVGFEPLDVGPLSAAGLLEHLALLWITVAFAGPYGRDFAFALLRRTKEVPEA